MTYRVWKPDPPNGDLRLLADSELKIEYGPKQPRKAVWDLRAIQEGLKADPPLKVIFSTNATFQMRDRLGWYEADALRFLSLLTPGHFRGSRWCYAPNGTTPHAADTYTMGFSRTAGIENQKLEPWAYIKFAAVGTALDRLYFFSAHPEGQYEG